MHLLPKEAIATEPASLSSLSYCSTHARHLPPPPAVNTQIVKPLWEPFVALFPNLDPLLENLNNNCEYYYEEGQRLEQQRLAATAAATAPSSLRLDEPDVARR